MNTNNYFFNKTMMFITLVTITSSVFAAPKLEVNSKSVNFGRFISSQRQSTTFSLKNSGDEPLKIIKIRKTCGCAVVKSTSSLIQPDASAEVIIDIIPNSLEGKFSKKVFIETNDPKQRFTVLTLTGESMPRVAVSPKERIYAERLIVGKKTSFTYTLTKSDVAITFKQPTVTCNYPAEVEMNTINKSRAQVILSVTPQEIQDPLRATVTIQTDADRKNDVQLHLSAEVGPALYALSPLVQIPRSAEHFQTSIKIQFAGIDLQNIDISQLEITPISGMVTTPGKLTGKDLTFSLAFDKSSIEALKSKTKRLTISYPNAKSARCRILVK